MFAFVKIRTRPTWNRLTIAYEHLLAATDEAVDALRSVRRLHNELNGAMEAKRRSQPVIDERAAAYASALIREQAARQPLCVALEELQTAVAFLPIGACKDTEGWPFWEVDALRVNLICSRALIEKAIRVGARFRRYPFPMDDEHFVLCSELQHPQAAAARKWLSELPCFPVVEGGSFSPPVWDLLLRCLQLTAETGQFSVSTAGVPGYSVEQVVRLLQQAKWSVACRRRTSGDDCLDVARPGVEATFADEANEPTVSTQTERCMMPSVSSQTWLVKKAGEHAAARQMQSRSQLGRTAAEGSCSAAELTAGAVVSIDPSLYRVYERAYEEALLQDSDAV